jgi:hypothetical protein
MLTMSMMSNCRVAVASTASCPFWTHSDLYPCRSSIDCSSFLFAQWSAREGGGALVNFVPVQAHGCRGGTAFCCFNKMPMGSQI